MLHNPILTTRQAVLKTTLENPHLFPWHVWQNGASALQCDGNPLVDSCRNCDDVNSRTKNKARLWVFRMHALTQESQLLRVKFHCLYLKEKGHSQHGYFLAEERWCERGINNPLFVNLEGQSLNRRGFSLQLPADDDWEGLHTLDSVNNEWRRSNNSVYISQHS